MPDKILVVDDDPLAAKLMKLSLAAEGFEVTTAQDAREGLLAVQTEQPALILLDIMMPGMDGLEMCRRLRSRPETAGIPIVFLTAKTQLDDKIAGLRTGADDYITKPVDPREVVARVQAVVARTRRIPATKGGQVISLIGARGGVGTSTVAVNLGAELARRKVSTLLVDLHHHAGTVAWQLGFAPRFSLAELLTVEATQIDSQRVAGVLLTHASGLRVLPGVVKGANLIELPPSQVRATVLAARPLANIVLLDLPHVISLASREAVVLSHMVLLVLGPELADVAAAEQLIPLLQDGERDVAVIYLVVVNRSRSASTLPVADIERRLGKSCLGSVAPAAEELTFSYRQGVPLVLSESQSLPVVSLRQLAERVHAQVQGLTTARR